MAVPFPATDMAAAPQLPNAPGLHDLVARTRPGRPVLQAVIVGINKGGRAVKPGDLDPVAVQVENDGAAIFNGGFIIGLGLTVAVVVLVVIRDVFRNDGGTTSTMSS